MTYCFIGIRTINIITLYYYEQVPCVFFFLIETQLKKMLIKSVYESESGKKICIPTPKMYDIFIPKFVLCYEKEVSCDVMPLETLNL